MDGDAVTDHHPRPTHTTAGCCVGLVRYDPQQINARINPPECASPCFHVGAVVSGVSVGHPLCAAEPSANRNPVIKVGV